jgi:hypothetical protein
MGNDGGSIPKRRELVKEAAKTPTAAQLKETLQEHQAYLWTTDPLTNQPLRTPIVSDCNGVLYSKDSILEFLLPAQDAAAASKRAEAEKLLAGAVRCLRDVVQVRFERDPEEAAGGGADAGTMAWICPVTRKRLGPRTKAVYLVPCGHAFSAAAVKEVSAGEACLQCGESYAAGDVVSILPTAEAEVERLAGRIKRLRDKGLTHSLKKAPGAKKRKKIGLGDANKGVDLVAAGEVGPGLVSAVGAAGTEPGANGGTQGVGIKNASTASLTAKVLEEQEQKQKRRKTEKNENLNSLFSARDQSKPLGRSSDFMSRGFTIPGHDKR